MRVGSIMTAQAKGVHLLPVVAASRYGRKLPPNRVAVAASAGDVVGFVVWGVEDGCPGKTCQKSEEDGGGNKKFFHGGLMIHLLLAKSCIVLSDSFIGGVLAMYFSGLESQINPAKNKPSVPLKLDK